MPARNARGGAAAQAAAGSSAEGDLASVVETVDMPYGEGHVLTLKKPHVLAGFRLVRLLDPEVARNVSYVDMLGTLLYVHKIDGDLIPFPQSERQIEALITRLDEAGMAAMYAGVLGHWGRPDTEADKDAIKN